MKIFKKLRTASLNSEFSGSYKKNGIKKCISNFWRIWLKYPTVKSKKHAQHQNQSSKPIWYYFI